MQIRERLLGTWRLRSWENRTEAGERSFPLGPEATGYLTYTRDGYMFVQIMAAGRAAFAFDDPLGGTIEEKATAAETHIAYCGSYEVAEDRVIHQIEVSSFPNWVGVDQLRFVEFENGILHLSTRPLLLGGQVMTAHVFWERLQRTDL